MLYPLFLKLEGRRVLVVGAGPVAARKVEDLVAAKAQVVVVAPEAVDAITALAARGTVEHHARRFEDADADGAWLLVACTSDPDAQRAVSQAGEARRLFVLAVDDLANTTAYGGSLIRRGDYTIAISSSGATPALTRLLREVLEQALPDDDWVEAARALRAKWKAEGTPMGSRFGDLVRAFKERG